MEFRLGFNILHRSYELYTRADVPVSISLSRILWVVLVDSKNGNCVPSGAVVTIKTE
jgi:hypothetical protein